MFENRLEIRPDFPEVEEELRFVRSRAARQRLSPPAK